jgi:hypothetical protein
MDGSIRDRIGFLLGFGAMVYLMFTTLQNTRILAPIKPTPKIKK